MGEAMFAGVCVCVARGEACVAKWCWVVCLCAGVRECGLVAARGVCVECERGGVGEVERRPRAAQGLLSVLRGGVFVCGLVAVWSCLGCVCGMCVCVFQGGAGLRVCARVCAWQHEVCRCEGGGPGGRLRASAAFAAQCLMSAWLAALSASVSGGVCVVVTLWQCVGSNVYVCAAFAGAAESVCSVCA